MNHVLIIFAIAVVAAYFIYTDARDNRYGRTKALIWGMLIGEAIILDLLAGILVMVIYYLVSRNKL